MKNTHKPLRRANRLSRLPHIRENFFDKYVTKDKKGGTGVGTYSAKLLAEAQHGNIAMTTSGSDNETIITVNLPRLL